MASGFRSHRLRTNSRRRFFTIYRPRKHDSGIAARTAGHSVCSFVFENDMGAGGEIRKQPLAIQSTQIPWRPGTRPKQVLAGPALSTCGVLAAVGLRGSHWISLPHDARLNCSSLSGSRAARWELWGMLALIEPKSTTGMQAAGPPLPKIWYQFGVSALLARHPAAEGSGATARPWPWHAPCDRTFVWRGVSCYTLRALSGSCVGNRRRATSRLRSIRCQRSSGGSGAPMRPSSGTIQTGCGLSPFKGPDCPRGPAEWR